MKFPFHGLFAVAERNVIFLQQFLNTIFVAAEVAESFGILQREFQRRLCVIKTDEADGTFQIARGAQNGERIRRRAEADVPDDKFANMILQPLAQAKLVDVKCLGFRDWPDHGMKRLAFRERMNAMHAAGELDDFVSAVGDVFRHARLETFFRRESNRKLGLNFNRAKNTRSFFHVDAGSFIDVAD